MKTNYSSKVVYFLSKFANAYLDKRKIVSRSSFPSMMMNYSTSLKTSRSYKDAINTLNNLQSNYSVIQLIRSTGNRNNKETIDQMVEFSKRIGYDPIEFNRLNVLHVTGTKGKGSTCAFLHSLASQYSVGKTGLYTSPHLKSVRERICINGEPISEILFAKYFFEVYDLLRSTDNDTNITTSLTKQQMPAYFKYLTLLSFYIFMKENVLCAIYEVGVGGELDSTNIIRNPISCGISSIGIDHTFMLGNTIEEISWNKSGIFKPGCFAFSTEQKPESEKVIRERASEKQVAEFQIVKVHPAIKMVKLGIAGEVQSINASLATAMFLSYLRKLKIPIYDEEDQYKMENSDVPKDISQISNFPKKIIKGLEAAHIDGRSQILKDKTLDNLTWFIDGSHTVESINKSAKWFKDEQSKRIDNNSIKILFFNQQSRNIESLLAELHSTLDGKVNFDYAVFTTNVTWSNNSYDTDLVSMNVDERQVDTLEMQKRAKKELECLQRDEDPGNKTHVNIFHDIESGVKAVNEIAKKFSNRGVDVFVNGSLHLVGGVLVVLDG